LQKEQQVSSWKEGGPVVLSTHAPAFVRLYEATGDHLFLDLARAGAVDKSTWVDPETGTASYYWGWFDRGAGAFPNHVWWQVGWTMDYLLAEVEIRIDGLVSFPRGPMTSKVGASRCLGFEPSTVAGDAAQLRLPRGLFEPDTPKVECIGATGVETDTFYAVLLNQDSGETTTTVTLDTGKILRARAVDSIGEVTALQEDVTASVDPGAVRFETTIPGWDVRVVEVEYEPGDHTFENVSVEREGDAATVRWGAVAATTGAVDHRESGADEWTRTDATRRKWVCSATIGAVDAGAAPDTDPDRS
jgi:hypothetical protein